MGVDMTKSVTRLLASWNAGDSQAIEQLVPVIYAELKRVARVHLARERVNTLQPTALVHETYLKLLDQRAIDWQNRDHFFAVCAQLMRRIVMKRARRRRAAKRGGGATHLTLDDEFLRVEERATDLIVLDDALDRLEVMDPRQSRIVELRFFAGLTVEQTADVLSISPGTVKREWRTAKAWLHAEIARGFEP